MPDDDHAGAERQVLVESNKPGFWSGLAKSVAWPLGLRTVAYGVGLLVLCLAIRYTNPTVVLVVGAALILGAVLMDRFFPAATRAEAEATSPLHVFLLVLIWMAVSVVGSVLVYFQRSSSVQRGFGSASSVALFLGLGLVLFGLGAVTTLCRSHLKRLRALFFVVCVALLLVGLGLLANDHPGAGHSSEIMLLVGLGLMPFSIGLASEWCIEALEGQRLRIPLAAGLALAAGVLLILVLSSRVVSLPIIAMLIVLGVLLFLIAVRSESDTLFLVIIIALIWVMAPRSVDPGTTPVLSLADKTNTIVALGDSYMSGEGARKFYTGTNVRHLNECRRAPTAYSVLTTESLNQGVESGSQSGLIFVACSGAKADQITDQPQYPGEPVGSISGGETQLQQLHDDLAANRQLKIDFVLLMIGGNDANFGNLVETCLGPGDCSELGKYWLSYLQPDQLPKKLDMIYDRVRAAVPGKPIIVVPYPLPIKASGCALSLLTDKEHKFLAGFAQKLDSEIQNAATRHGFGFARPVEDALTTSKGRLCDSDNPAKLQVNWVFANPTQGTDLQAVVPSTWFHDSMHPTAAGHAVVANALETWLKDQPLGAMAGTKPQDVRDAAPSMQSIMCAGVKTPCAADTNLPSYCPMPTALARALTPDVFAKTCASRWQEESTFHAVFGIGGLLTLLFGVGVWMCGCVLIAWRRRSTQTPAWSPAEPT